MRPDKNPDHQHNGISFQAYPELVPEVIPHAGQVDEAGGIIFPAPNITDHNWRQRGIMIECDACEVPHGFAVDPDKQLTGIDERGYPIIKSISTTR